MLTCGLTPEEKAKLVAQGVIAYPAPIDPIQRKKLDADLEALEEEYGKLDTEEPPQQPANA